MYITIVSWERFKGQADWKDGVPGGPLIHTTCGGSPINVKEQMRSIWTEDCPGGVGGNGETTVVGELYCVKCHSVPTTTFGEPIFKREFFDPEARAVAA